MINDFSYLDPLYGKVEFDSVMTKLIFSPAMQRLRHVSLSNIDSLDLPGIAKTTRFEHSLGVAALVQNLGMYKELDSNQKYILLASALLHDWAITPFGHLVEEAYQYTGKEYNHELKPLLLSGNITGDLGGINTQILEGREASINKWISSAFNKAAQETSLNQILSAIHGEGRFGKLLAGDFDLDNLDNIWRIAYHLGLKCNRHLPVKIAKSIIRIDSETNFPVFKKDAENYLQDWSDIRREVYNRLMLAPNDFIGKAMVIYSTVKHLESTQEDWQWKFTEYEFINKLRAATDKIASTTMCRWLAGELWSSSPLIWLNGQRPKFSEIYLFSKVLSNALSREVFCYAIKDKRERSFTVIFNDKTRAVYGSNPSQWLIGATSPKNVAFSKKEVDLFVASACNFFNTSQITDIENRKCQKKQMQLTLI